MYSREKNVQILISLLKQHNIKRVIASPGTSHIGFLGSIQNDDFFDIYSCVDERSAAYMACGLCDTSKEPVIIVCTGATASRNYFPGLTEAYYRKLPILVITASHPYYKIGKNLPQVLDRRIQPSDTVKYSVHVPLVKDQEDINSIILSINKAILELNKDVYGPVHIDLEATYDKNFDVSKIDNYRLIKRVNKDNKLPVINSENVAIFIGEHQNINLKLESAIDEFCEKYNGVVLCDHTSKYHGKYRILPNILLNQEKYESSLKNINLLIHFGNISGSYIRINPKIVWRVNEDGNVVDTFDKLQYVFKMDEYSFLKAYNSLKELKDKDTSYYNLWNNEISNIRDSINDIPFSNLWVSKQLEASIPDNSIVYLSILNTLRSWNYFDSNKNINCYSNTGGFGIDGILSSTVGSSLYDKNKLNFCIIGDLAFFYDMNALGNREITNNLRVLIINNDGGQEFRNYTNITSSIGDDVNKYLAAKGHYRSKTNNLIKNYSESLNMLYLSANNKKEFMDNLNIFTSPKLTNSPIIFEVFVDEKNENEALKIINNIKSTKSSVIKNKSKQIAKSVLSENMKNRLKDIIGR